MQIPFFLDVGEHFATDDDLPLLAVDKLDAAGAHGAGVDLDKSRHQP